jgi:hypothetical protein
MSSGPNAKAQQHRQQDIKTRKRNEVFTETTDEDEIVDVQGIGVGCV